MIDIKFLRENPDVVKQNIKNKFQNDKLPLVDEVIELDKQARYTQSKQECNSKADWCSYGSGKEGRGWGS